MNETFLVITIPFLLIIGGIVSFLFKKLAAILSTFFFSLSFIINSWILLNVGENAFVFPNIAGIVINASSAFIIEIALLLGLLSVIYSYEYFEDKEILPQFYLLFSFFIATLILMVSSFNILIIYISFEASTIAGGILILFTRRRSATKAAIRFFILSLTGAIIILSGILYQQMLGGFILIREVFSKINNFDLTIIASLYAIGFGIKVGIFPFGLMWLPPAHSEAPIPVHAMLSGLMVQIAAFSVARIIGVIFPMSNILSQILIILGVLSVITGAILVFIEAILGSKYSRFHVGLVNIRGLKRIWAFSTCSDVGVFYILLGLALSFPLLISQYFAGILTHFLNHGLAKALLLFDSGYVIETSRIEDLTIMKGLGRKLGITGFTFLIGGLSLALMPGTLGYIIALEIIKGHLNREIAIPILIGASLIFITVIYSLIKIAFGRPKVKIEYLRKVEDYKILRIPGIVLASLLLILGIIVLLGSTEIAFQNYYHELEKWFSIAAKTIIEPWVRSI
ncbi:MAG: proton-conducting transporter membrane subunit [Candidatus Methanomethylicaceae archaeon]|nr:proton-conducting transporter membrane subunit [Candidatus Verstraetearchaeota archaeon]